MPNKIYKRFHSQRRFGVEIEVGSDISKAKVAKAVRRVSDRPVRVTSYATSNDNCYWHIKEDSSCGNHGYDGPKGVEIASYIGQGSQDIANISSMADTLLEIGCRVNNNCGLHIHAEVTDMSAADVGIMLAWWMKMEQVLCCAFPVRRSFGMHSKLTCPASFFAWHPSVGRSSGDTVVRGRRVTRDDNYGPLGLLEIFGPRDFSQFDNNDRRVNLNIVNVMRALRDGTDFRKTIELRWPEGTLSSEAIRCWIRFILGFIDSAKRMRYPVDLHPISVEEVLACCGLSCGRGVVLSHSLAESRRWLLTRISHGVQHDMGKVMKKSVLSKIISDANNLLEKFVS